MILACKDMVLSARQVHKSATVFFAKYLRLLLLEIKCMRLVLGSLIILLQLQWMTRMTHAQADLSRTEFPNDQMFCELKNTQSTGHLIAVQSNDVISNPFFSFLTQHQSTLYISNPTVKSEVNRVLLHGLTLRGIMSKQCWTNAGNVQCIIVWILRYNKIVFWFDTNTYSSKEWDRSDAMRAQSMHCELQLPSTSRRDSEM